MKTLILPNKIVTLTDYGELRFEQTDHSDSVTGQSRTDTLLLTFKDEELDQLREMLCHAETH